jgi:hypothetical protein
MFIYGFERMEPEIWFDFPDATNKLEDICITITQFLMMIGESIMEGRVENNVR